MMCSHKQYTYDPQVKVSSQYRTVVYNLTAQVVSTSRHQAKVAQWVHSPTGQQGAVWTRRSCTAVSPPLHTHARTKNLSGVQREGNII